MLPCFAFRRSQHEDVAAGLHVCVAMLHYHLLHRSVPECYVWTLYDTSQGQYLGHLYSFMLGAGVGAAQGVCCT
jgi:hypothetical protein